MFWATDGMLIAHLILSMLVGCIVAFATKGREMVATMTLGLVLSAMVGVAYFGWVAEHWPIDMALCGCCFNALVRSRSFLAEQSSECVEQPRKLGLRVRNRSGLKLNVAICL